MKTCKECTNAIFDEIWGEYKCKVYQHVIYEVEDAEDCGKYKKEN